MSVERLAIYRVLLTNFSCGALGSLVTIIVSTLQLRILGLRKVKIQGCWLLSIMFNKYLQLTRHCARIYWYQNDFYNNKTKALCMWKQRASEYPQPLKWFFPPRNDSFHHKSQGQNSYLRVSEPQLHDCSHSTITTLGTESTQVANSSVIPLADDSAPFIHSTLHTSPLVFIPTLEDK